MQGTHTPAAQDAAVGAHQHIFVVIYNCIFKQNLDQDLLKNAYVLKI